MRAFGLLLTGLVAALLAACQPAGHRRELPEVVEVTVAVEDGVRLFNVIAGYDPADPFTELGRGRREEDYTRFLDQQGLAAHASASCAHSPSPRAPSRRSWRSSTPLSPTWRGPAPCSSIRWRSTA